MGVQEEADQSVVDLLDDLKIDKAFVLPPEHRPVRAHDSYVNTTDQIPVIDLQVLQHPAPDPTTLETLVREIGRACENWGFFQVINHGISSSLINKLKEEAESFFALPLEEKRQVKRTRDNVLGYNDAELTKNVRDWKEVFDIAVRGVLELPVELEGGETEIQSDENKWPTSLPGLRDACEEYIAAAQELAFSLLRLMSQSLGLQPCYFDEYFKSAGTSFLRLNHYPVCPAPGLALGVSRHKDGGGLTILLQDEVGGLEVRRKDGEWIGVKPDPAAIVINVGDLIQVWSNDKYQSVEHRVVVNENKDRYSFPLFFNPVHMVDVSPIPELTDAQHPPRYTPINWGKYYKSRKDSNFKNLGVENRQIYHYALNV